MNWLKSFWLRIFPEKKAGLPPLKALPAPSDTTNQSRMAFWKQAINATFQPGAQELVVYFCVTRSASRARLIQQQALTQSMVRQADCKAEVLRLVGWQFDKPSVIVEVRATSERAWACEQVTTVGMREPFGYVVLASVFAPGLVNSMTMNKAELFRAPVRFALAEDSTYVRV